MLECRRPWREKMRKAIALAAIIALSVSTLMAGDEKDEREDKRLESCGKIFGEIMNVPEATPRFVLDHADCVIVLPGVKKGNGFIFTAGFGGTFGRGAMTCRSGEHFDGPWGAPTMVALEGMNWGLAAGGASSDVLIFVMNPSGASSVLTTKAKIGGNASATAGTVGRDVAAEEDVALHSELVTFARAKGLLAGITLTGSTLRADGPANEKIYGKKIDAKDVVLHGAEKPPAAAKLLLDTLNTQSPKNLSDPKSR